MPGNCRQLCSTLIVTNVYLKKPVKYCACWLELHILRAGLQHYHSTENKEWEVEWKYLLIKEVFQATNCPWQHDKINTVFCFFFLNYILCFVKKNRAIAIKPFFKNAEMRHKTYRSPFNSQIRSARPTVSIGYTYSLPRSVSGCSSTSDNHHTPTTRAVMLS